MLLPRGSADAGRFVPRTRILPRDALGGWIAESRFGEDRRLRTAVLF